MASTSTLLYVGFNNAGGALLFRTATTTPTGTLDIHLREDDSVLAQAPWNDSLRARIYAQYRYLASTQTNPSMRKRMMERADALYHAR